VTLIDSLFHPAVWVALLLAGRAIAAHHAWLYDHGLEPPGAVARLRASANAAAALRVAYLAGPLVLAVALRVGDARDLGLVRPPASFAPLIVGLTAAAAIAGSRLWFEHVTDYRLPRSAPGKDTDYWGRVALQALALEAHWALFRAGTLSIGFAEMTLAVYLALGLLALEGWSDPARRLDLVDPEAAVGLARGAAFAIVSAVTFILTGSLAACILAHLAAAIPLGYYGFLPLPWRNEVEPRTVPEARSIEPTVV
jgi:hypothetical protein